MSLSAARDSIFARSQKCKGDTPPQYQYYTLKYFYPFFSLFSIISNNDFVSFMIFIELISPASHR